MSYLKRILLENTDVSGEFASPVDVSVTMDGVLTAKWKIERAEGELNDGGNRTWIEHDVFGRSINGAKIQCSPGYVYRINLNSGNGAAGLVGNYVRVYGNNWR